MGKYLPSIAKDGEIEVATAFVPKGERPAVWCSTNPLWEETANKMFLENGKLILGDKETTARLGGGLIRIEVAEEAVPLNWIAFKKLHGRNSLLTALEKVSRDKGADPYEWRMSLDPIPADKWLIIEKWNQTTNKWKKLFERMWQ